MYVTVADAAAQLRISRQTVYRLIESGDLRTAGSVRRGVPIEIEKASIEQYIISSSSAGAIDPPGIPQLLTLKEVAARTGFALRTLERDCRADRIPHVHCGRARMMTGDQVAALIKRYTTGDEDGRLRDQQQEASRLAAEQRVIRMAARSRRR